MNKGKFPDKCPNCKSTDLDYGDMDSHGDGIDQHVECLNCNNEYTEYFKPIGWD